MKARSLLSCILLSILLILLLSTAVQATEYREVKAEEILKQIEYGEDVNYTDCHIVGELNTSNITLKTVPNPYYNELLKKGTPKEELIYYGLSENLRIIKSNIIIKDSIFENDLKFSNVLFDSSADFSWAKFNSSADFSGAKFNSSADFSGAKFNSDAYFYKTTFNSYADFSWAKFNSSADFEGPDTSENIITNGRTYVFFVNFYNNEARYTDADNIRYEYLKISQANKSFTDPSKWIDLFSWVICGYGIKFEYILPFIVYNIIVFAIIYRNPFDWKKPGIYRSSEATSENKSRVSFKDCLYFSVNTFTRLGSTDWHSRENFSIWVALEGFLGWILFMQLLLTQFMSLMIRK